MKKLGALNCICMFVFSMMLTVMLSFGCKGTVVNAQTYYGSVEEMKQNMSWWENYTLGTMQRVWLERLEGADTWEWQVMDCIGSTRDDLVNFFEISEDHYLCIDGYNEQSQYDYIGNGCEEMASGVYYVIFTTYSNGIVLEGCVEINYKALRQMPLGKAVLVGSAPCDY